MNLVLFGPPGSGKGTQSKRIVQQYGLTHISTGDALRSAIINKTPLGLKAQETMEKGGLVSDEMVTELLRELIKSIRQKSSSFLFDGYPRTVRQVTMLDGLIDEFTLEQPAVINLEVPDETLILRLSGRRICAKCHATFNIYFDPPKRAGICDICKAPLLKRVDDNAETVRERLRVYRDQSEPVIDLYHKRGQLVGFDATGEPDGVFTKICNLLTEYY